MDKRELLAEYGRLLYEAKMVIGAGGNISEKEGDSFVVKMKGADMSRGRKEDYLQISFLAAEQGVDDKRRCTR